MVERRQPNDAGSHRPWPSFSAASFPRLLLDFMRCGASSWHRSMSPEQQPPLPPRKLGTSGRRLSELLKSAAADDSEDTNSSSSSSGSSGDWDARRKMEAFEEVCKVVKLLQFEEEKEKRKQAALEVRRLAKDDADARETLAMLGAIPTLVGMLDTHNLLVELDFQVHVLYALLNLGIGNDMQEASQILLHHFSISSSVFFFALSFALDVISFVLECSPKIFFMLVRSIEYIWLVRYWNAFFASHCLCF